MARPREFDEAVALDAAIQCFWSRGYEATSVRDLADAMGIAGPSLYNTFGDKRTLGRRSNTMSSEAFAIGSGASSPSWHLVRPSVRSSMRSSNCRWPTTSARDA